MADRMEGKAHLMSKDRLKPKRMGTVITLDANTAFGESKQTIPAILSMSKTPRTSMKKHSPAANSHLKLKHRYHRSRAGVNNKEPTTPSRATKPVYTAWTEVSSFNKSSAMNSPSHSQATTASSGVVSPAHNSHRIRKAVTHRPFSSSPASDRFKRTREKYLSSSSRGTRSGAVMVQPTGNGQSSVKGKKKKELVVNMNGLTATGMNFGQIRTPNPEIANSRRVSTNGRGSFDGIANINTNNRSKMMTSSIKSEHDDFNKHPTRSGKISSKPTRHGSESGSALENIDNYVFVKTSEGNPFSTHLSPHVSNHQNSDESLEVFGVSQQIRDHRHIQSRLVLTTESSCSPQNSNLDRLYRRLQPSQLNTRHDTFSKSSSSSFRYISHAYLKQWRELKRMNSMVTKTSTSPSFSSSARGSRAKKLPTGFNFYPKVASTGKHPQQYYERASMSPRIQSSRQERGFSQTAYGHFEDTDEHGVITGTKLTEEEDTDVLVEGNVVQLNTQRSASPRK